MKKILMMLIAIVTMISIVGCTKKDDTIVLHLSYGDREGVYEGDMVDGVPNGTGKFTTQNEAGEQWIYEGGFVDGHFEGEGTTTWTASGHFETGTYENDNLIPMSKEETEKAFKNSEKYAGHLVEVTGKVNYIYDVTDEYTILSMFCDPENYDKDVFVAIYGDDIDIGKDDYLKATGIIMSDNEFKAFGYYSNDMAVKVKEWEVMDYISAMSPTIKAKDVNLSQDQLGYTITIQKVEFADNETRIYMSMSNNGVAKFSCYKWNMIISQNGRQLEYKENWIAEYPELNDNLLPGNSTEGIMTFDAIDKDAPFSLTIEAYSDDWHEDIEDYVFDIE